jgi:hypothetical protein
VAHYTNGCPNVPDAWTAWTIWQYTSSGTDDDERDTFADHGAR